MERANSILNLSSGSLADQEQERQKMEAIRTYSYIRLPCLSFMDWLRQDGLAEFEKALEACQEGGGVGHKRTQPPNEAKLPLQEEEEEEGDGEMEGGEDPRFLSAKKIKP